MYLKRQVGRNRPVQWYLKVVRPGQDRGRPGKTGQERARPCKITVLPVFFVIERGCGSSSMLVMWQIWPSLHCGQFTCQKSTLAALSDHSGQSSILLPLPKILSELLIIRVLIANEFLNGILIGSMKNFEGIWEICFLQLNLLFMEEFLMSS